MEDLYSMSDEELSSMSVEDINKASLDMVQNESGNEGETDEGEQEDIPSTESDNTPTDAGAEGSGLPVEEGGEGTEEEENSSPKEDTEEKDESDVSTPQQILDALYAPIKANGAEVVVKDMEDIRALISKGLGYDKNQRNIKPHLKTIKVLKNNGLLDDPTKLAHLIQVSQNNPDAIAKVLKDSGLNPVDIDTEKEDYTPKVETISDKDVELDAVFDSLQDSPSFQETLGYVTDTWDDDSREAVKNHPAILNIMNEHVSSGMYAKIAAEVAKERALGRQLGKSFIQSYDEVGNRMTEQGAFKPENVTEPTNDPKEGNTPITTPDTNIKDKLNAQRKKAGAGTNTPTPPKAEFPDLSSLSDEEFLKQIDKYI